MSVFLTEEEAAVREQNAPLNKIILEMREKMLKAHDEREQNADQV
jgi:hypothetical protein